MESRSIDPEDFFDSSVLLEERHYKEGYKNGYNDGLVSGKKEGREVGLKMGFQAGEELGFYCGCVDIWSSAIRIDPGAFSSRVKKRINELRELVEKYPLLEPENEHLQETMDSIRLKFRIISANLGLGHGLTYEGFPVASSDDVENI